ncbi:MAG TPA: hypothetical protein VMG08_13390 [Allosphingosinicella sp.]|nr:hypothetical protein [Allosphingosinicella sp.]
MSTLLTINVRNMERNQGFYFFQQPSIYTGGAQVFSNSLFSSQLGNFNDDASVLTFQVNMQFYAGIQEGHSSPQVGQSSGFSSASRPIDLAPASGTANDWTKASVDPLGLSVPVPGPGVQAGAFRITTPSYAPPASYNVGSAVAANGGIVLSNFVVSEPTENTDCQPILKYYVQTGEYTRGTVMDFTQSSATAALCDFTGGYTIMDVMLNADGTWDVQIVK